MFTIKISVGYGGRNVKDVYENMWLKHGDTFSVNYVQIW